MGQGGIGEDSATDGTARRTGELRLGPSTRTKVEVSKGSSESSSGTSGTGNNKTVCGKSK